MPAGYSPRDYSARYRAASSLDAGWFVHERDAYPSPSARSGPHRLPNSLPVIVWQILPRLDGDRDRPTSRVVRGIGTGHTTAAGIAPADRVEVEPRLAGLGQATAARGTCDRRAGAVANGEGPMGIGSGRVEHRGHLLAHRGPGGALGHPRETFPHHGRSVGPTTGPSRHHDGCPSVAGGYRRLWSPHSRVDRTFSRTAPWGTMAP